jgi:hypothetical protein
MGEVMTPDIPPDKDRKDVFNGLLEEGIRKRDTELVTLALKNGAEPNRLLFAGITFQLGLMDRWRRTPADTNVQWVRLALDSGADVNATKLYTDNKPWPAIHWAQAYFDPAVISALLDHGAGVDTLSPQGRTPLMDAVRGGLSAEIEFYLSRGADPLFRCAGGKFPLKELGNSEIFDEAEKLRLKKLMMQRSAAKDFAVDPALVEAQKPSSGLRFSL